MGGDPRAHAPGRSPGRLDSARRILVVAFTLVLLLLVVAVALALVGIGARQSSPVSFAFVPYWDQQRGFEEVDRHAQAISIVGPWWYAPSPDGGVVEQHAEYTDVDLVHVRELQDRGLQVMPVVANHRDGAWDFEVVGEILSDPAVLQDHVAALTDLVLEHDFDGLQLDYENLAEQDADTYVELVRRLADALDRHDRTLAVAVHARTGPQTDGWGAGHDYAGLGRHADQLHVMAYDLHYSGSAPGPTAPLWWVQDVIEHATAVVPSHKVVLGIGLFGYDWPEGGQGEGVTLAEAEARVRRYGGELVRDGESQTPRLHYQRDGRAHELWFEDPRSLGRKLELVEVHGLGGAFFWRMGGTTQDTWETVRTVLGPVGP